MQATLYQAKTIVQLDPDAVTPDAKQCNWLTQPVEDSEMIELASNAIVKVNREGVVIKKPQPKQNEEIVNNFMFPSNEEVIWDIDVQQLADAKPKESL